MPCQHAGNPQRAKLNVLTGGQRPHRVAESLARRLGGQRQRRAGQVLPSQLVEVVGVLVMGQQYGIDRPNLLGGGDCVALLTSTREPTGCGPAGSNVGSVNSRRPAMSTRAVGPPR